MKDEDHPHEQAAILAGAHAGHVRHGRNPGTLAYRQRGFKGLVAGAAARAVGDRTVVGMQAREALHGRGERLFGLQRARWEKFKTEFPLHFLR